MDDEFLHLIERRIFEHIVDSPGTVSHFEIVTISELFRKIRDLRIEGFLISFVLDFLDEVRGVVCLGSESITDLDSVCREDLRFRNLASKSVPSLRKDNLIIPKSGLRRRDDEFETATDTSILVDREEYSIHSSYFFYDLHTKAFILETLTSTFEFCLFIIVHDDPDLIGSCLCARQLEALYVSWVDRIEVSRCDSKSSHGD